MKNLKTKAQNMTSKIKWCGLFLTGNLTNMYSQNNDVNHQNNFEGIWMNLLGVFLIILLPLVLKGTIEGISFSYAIIKQTIYELLGILEQNKTV